MGDLAVAGASRHAESPGAEGLGAESPGSAPRRTLNPLAALAAALAAEDDRRILWIPVFFGTGIAFYFTLTIEPPLWVGIALTSAAAAIALGLRRWPVLCTPAIVLAVVAAGFAVMQASRLERGTAMLDRRLGPVAMTGTVVDIDAVERGWRIIVAPDPLPGLAADAQPHRLRSHIAKTSDTLQPGDQFSVKAMLYPVPAQVLPGGRDMQRELYFAGIGGVGYSYGGARRIATAEENTGGGWREWLLQLRAEMTRRINAALPGSTGGVASAVITGKRGTMAEEVKQAFRQSGLSHLLAIAGLHLGLVGGFVFFAVRGGLALIPFVALRYPIKKIIIAGAGGAGAAKLQPLAALRPFQFDHVGLVIGLPHAGSKFVAYDG
jgi:competence protein ComEC